MVQAIPSIKVNTGELRIMINDDPDRLIIFNPEDMIFVEKFYRLSERLNEYKEKMSVLLEVDEVDENDTPLNSIARVELMSELSKYIRAQVDELFGSNAATNVFGSTTSLDAFAQFIEGVTPYVRDIRKEKVAKYSAKKVSKKTSAQTKAK